MTKLLIVIYLFFSFTSAYANNVAKFFASNNTNIIDTDTAYGRLSGTVQHNLYKTMLNIFQKAHLEQGEFENILGAYQMSSDKKITADNSEIFYVSPQQILSNENVFKIGQI